MQNVSSQLDNYPVHRQSGVTADDEAGEPIATEAPSCRPASAATPNVSGDASDKADTASALPDLRKLTNDFIGWVNNSGVLIAESENASVQRASNMGTHGSVANTSERDTTFNNRPTKACETSEAKTSAKAAMRSLRKAMREVQKLAATADDDGKVLQQAREWMDRFNKYLATAEGAYAARNQGH